MSYMHKQFDPKKHQRYTPKNKEKYIGKDLPIARSGLEYSFMEILDQDPKVVQWSSESFYIPYVLNGKRHRYFPDFFVKIKHPLGSEEKWVVELKPYKECKPPTISKNKSRKTKLYEKFTWQKNQAKWKAAQTWCKKMDFVFKIITEKQVFKKG